MENKKIEIAVFFELKDFQFEDEQKFDKIEKRLIDYITNFFQDKVKIKQTSLKITDLK